MSGFKKLLFGEKMPDKDDPQYKARYAKEVEAGQQFARNMRIDKLAVSIQLFANKHRYLFLGLVSLFIASCLAFTIYRMAMIANYKDKGVSAVQYQEQLLKKRHDDVTKKISKNKSLKQEDNGTTKED